MYQEMLLIFDMGHEEINVSLYIYGECLYKLKELSIERNVKY